MTLEKLMKKELPPIPNEIKNCIDTNSKITLIEFEKRDEVLKSSEFYYETGYAPFSNGDYLVSMYCPMPNVTPDMIKWWFWWHPKDNMRYKAWFPGEHFSIGFSKKDTLYFNHKHCPEFEPNTQFPTERIGKLNMPLRIDFVSPEQFGFSKDAMNANNIPIIICGHVGAFTGAIWHTEMAHIFKQTDDGLLLISRFWLGKTLNNKLIRKFMLTDKTAKGMAEHCCVEYRNLAKILPELYEQYSDSGVY